MSKNNYDNNYGNMQNQYYANPNNQQMNYNQNYANPNMWQNPAYPQPVKTSKKKSLIVVAIVVAVVLILGYVGYNLLGRFTYEKPVYDIVNGFNDNDGDKILGAVPEEIVDSFGKNAADNIDDGLDELKSQFEKQFDEDDYKLKVKIIGSKKLDKDTLDSLMDTMYKGSDIKITSAYYLDCKFIADLTDDKLYATIGLTVGKIDGDWYIVGGDALVVGTSLSIADYVFSKNGFDDTSY